MKIIALNKQAKFEYHILETIEAGLVLTGDEVKSIRANKVSLSDSYAVEHNGELMLLNCYIAPYSHAFNPQGQHDTSRQSRKLLLHKKEIVRLIGLISRQGVTLVPLKLYFGNRGYIKVEIAVAKHKKLVDKRRTIKDRDLQREMGRNLKIKI